MGGADGADPGNGFPGADPRDGLPGSGPGCCTASGTGFGNVAQALRAGRAVAAYLNSPAARDLEGPARGEALEQLGTITSLLGAAQNGWLRRFDADGGHDADGYASAAAWLAAWLAAWSGGCDRRPAVSDVHHVTHKKDGGPTSVKDCALLCNYHHDVCIHRLGWKFELLPDGSTRATSPDGKTILRSHGPPPPQQPQPPQPGHPDAQP